MLRLGILILVGLVVYLLVRMVVRSMQQGSRRQPEVTMPYCQKCESNRNVVVNSGEAEDQAMRWYCTRCKEGF